MVESAADAVARRSPSGAQDIEVTGLCPDLRSSFAQLELGRATTEEGSMVHKRTPKKSSDDFYWYLYNFDIKDSFRFFITLFTTCYLCMVHMGAFLAGDRNPPDWVFSGSDSAIK